MHHVHQFQNNFGGPMFFINQRRDQYLVQVEAEGVEQKHTQLVPCWCEITCPQASENTKYLDVSTYRAGSPHTQR